MQYALLIYGTADGRRSDADRSGIDPAIAEMLTRPYVVSWARLQDPGTATTIRDSPGTNLLVDGPFIDSKEFLGGVIVIEAVNLDAALAIAGEFQDARIDVDGGIEVRPVRG